VPATARARPADDAQPWGVDLKQQARGAEEEDADEVVVRRTERVDRIERLGPAGPGRRQSGENFPATTPLTLELCSYMLPAETAACWAPLEQQVGEPGRSRDFITIWPREMIWPVLSRRCEYMDSGGPIAGWARSGSARWNIGPRQAEKTRGAGVLGDMRCESGSITRRTRCTDCPRTKGRIQPHRFPGDARDKTRSPPPFQPPKLGEERVPIEDHASFCSPTMPDPQVKERDDEGRRAGRGGGEGDGKRNRRKPSTG